MAIEHGKNESVDRDRFSGARLAGDEQVRRLRQVGHLDVAGDVLAQHYRHAGAVRLEGLALHDFLEGHDGPLLVRHLDADGVLAGNGRHDAHAGGGQPQGDIVAQVGDFREAHARRRQYLEHGDNRPLADAGNLGLDVELGQGFLEHDGRPARLVVDQPILTIGIRGQQVFGRHAIGQGRPGFDDGVMLRRHRDNRDGLHGPRLGEVGDLGD